MQEVQPLSGKYTVPLYLLQILIKCAHQWMNKAVYIHEAEFGTVM